MSTPFTWVSCVRQDVTGRGRCWDAVAALRLTDCGAAPPMPLHLAGCMDPEKDCMAFCQALWCARFACSVYVPCARRRPPSTSTSLPPSPCARSCISDGCKFAAMWDDRTGTNYGVTSTTKRECAPCEGKTKMREKPAQPACPPPPLMPFRCLSPLEHRLLQVHPLQVDYRLGALLQPGRLHQGVGRQLPRPRDYGSEQACQRDSGQCVYGAAHVRLVDVEPRRQGEH